MTYIRVRHTEHAGSNESKKYAHLCADEWLPALTQSRAERHADGYQGSRAQPPSAVQERGPREPITEGHGENCSAVPSFVVPMPEPPFFVSSFDCSRATPPHRARPHCHLERKTSFIWWFRTRLRLGGRRVRVSTVEDARGGGRCVDSPAAFFSGPGRPHTCTGHQN